MLMMGGSLERAGCIVHHARGDVDLLIAKTAIAIAQQHDTVVFDIWLQTTSSKKTSQCWNIAAIRESLGETVVNYILFAHAVLGCDTTSGVYGIGKQKAVSKLKADKNFKSTTTIFMSRHANVEEIVNAGNSSLIFLCNGRSDDMLVALRSQRFCEKNARRIIAIDPCLLSPTSAAAK